MIYEMFEVKPGTRNHRGFFIKEVPYKLVDLDTSGWALICMNDAICYYVDPDDLEVVTVAEAED